MPEPILCEYLLKLVTDADARARFFALEKPDKIKFLMTLGLLEGPANDLASLDEFRLKQDVEDELKSKDIAPIGGHHTIQMTINLPDSLKTHKK
jgi:hypothetical protein